MTKSQFEGLGNTFKGKTWVSLTKLIRVVMDIYLLYILHAKKTLTFINLNKK